jgi:hypothetical protein
MFIIERILNYGSESDEKALVYHFSRGDIKKALRKGNILEESSIWYYCLMTGMRKERCKCFKKR